MNKLRFDKDGCEQATSSNAASKWSDDDTCVQIEQFTEAMFDTGSVSYEKHALFFSFTGVVELQLPDGSFHYLLPGQGAFHASNQIHRALTKKPTSFIRVLFPKSVLSPVPEELEWTSQAIVADPYLTSVMELIDREMGTHDHHRDDSLSHLSQYLATHLIRTYSILKINAVVKAGRAEICEIMAALEYIEMNITSQIVLSEITQRGSLSPGLFLQAFKEVTGQTPRQYIINRRIETAKHLLRRAELSIDEIAKRTGFVDQSHFTKAFRKHFGLTPAACRRG
ncbi:MAG: AraC family transcriptional regulator [Candidatus Obscuribacterales bacterium]|nr:AraC family transcriptional regulator [Candidatus Obscuribacterales bacterium]